MKNKSTHTGECQCCGRRQMLPNGVLSTHGYTVDWGFFNGVCQGAHQLPFEKSCDLIKVFIESAQAFLARLRAEQITIRQPSTVAKCWIHHYFNYGWDRTKKSGYKWIQVDLKEEIHTYQSGGQDRSYSTYSYVVEGKEKKAESYGVYDKTVFQICDGFNERYAKTFDVRISQTEQYITWQTKRVLEWKEQDLKPIK